METNVTEVSTWPDISNLSAEKLQQLETIMASILAMPVARDTYAQIIDGSVVHDHSKISDEAIKQYEEIRKGFTARALKIDTQVHSRPTSVDHYSPADFAKADPELSECAVG